MEPQKTTPNQAEDSATTKPNPDDIKSPAAEGGPQVSVDIQGGGTDDSTADTADTSESSLGGAALNEPSDTGEEGAKPEMPDVALRGDAGATHPASPDITGSTADAQAPPTETQPAGPSAPAPSTSVPPAAPTLGQPAPPAFTPDGNAPNAPLTPTGLETAPAPSPDVAPPAVPQSHRMMVLMVCIVVALAVIALAAFVILR